jgi:transcriptional regulator with XRE-family HTH domain
MSRNTILPAQKEAFANWLTSQLIIRQWKGADLARQATLSVNTVHLLLHARSVPRPASCQSLARALNLPLDLVYEQAGYLSATGPETLSSPKRSLIEFVKRMPEADALKLLARSQARRVTQADGKWWV